MYNPFSNFSIFINFQNIKIFFKFLNNPTIICILIIETRIIVVLSFILLSRLLLLLFWIFLSRIRIFFILPFFVLFVPKTLFFVLFSLIFLLLLSLVFFLSSSSSFVFLVYWIFIPLLICFINSFIFMLFPYLSYIKLGYIYSTPCSLAQYHQCDSLSAFLISNYSSRPIK